MIRQGFGCWDTENPGGSRNAGRDLGWAGPAAAGCGRASTTAPRREGMDGTPPGRRDRESYVIGGETSAWV